MGKTETIAIIVIMLVIFAWMYLNPPKQQPNANQQTGTEPGVQPGQPNSSAGQTNGGTTKSLSKQNGTLP